MREKNRHLYLDSDERTVLIQGLNKFRNQLINEGRYTDVIDEVLFNIIAATIKKLKVKNMDF
ncbi:MAG: hypothetical protein R3Y35_11260 [Clostridia bacterium]